MVDVKECSLLQAKDADELVALVIVENRNGQTFSTCALTLQFFNVGSRLISQKVVKGGAISPGEQVLRFTVRRPRLVYNKVLCALEVLLSRWVTTVRHIEPLQLERSGTTPPPASAEAKLLTAPRRPVPVPPPAPAPPPEPVDSEPSPPPSRASSPSPAASEGPWSFVDNGDLAAAAEAFQRHRLTTPGQKRLRNLLMSTHVEDVRLGVQIFQWTGQRTPLLLIHLLEHPSALVRRDAVEVLGYHLGLTMLNTVKPLIKDDDPSVVEAAQTAIKRMRGIIPR